MLDHQNSATMLTGNQSASYTYVYKIKYSHYHCYASGAWS